jgi:phosphopantetheine attachment domain protein
MEFTEEKVNEIKEKIYNIIKDMMTEEGKKIESNQYDVVENLDSIEFVSLIVEIETEFNIEIDDNDYDIEKMNSVEKLTNLVSRYIINN